MNRIIEEKMETFEKRRNRRKQYYRIMLCLALCVAIGVSWKLKLTGISITGEAMCGEKEHSHSEACYEKVLICTELDTVDSVEKTIPHVHDDTCYEMLQSKVCQMEEHAHSEACYVKHQNLECMMTEHTHEEACYGEDGTLLCEISEHVHTDTCYETVTECVCGAEEHVHSDACYVNEQVLVCEMETELFTETEVPLHEHTALCYENHLICEEKEHTHILACYSDKNADIESAAIWEATLPEQLTGIWHEDIIAIAKSQLGYTESTRNFEVDETTQKQKGYTRYGEWYGNPYGDWCAMFVSFCMYYTDISESDMPYGSGCYAWSTKLKEKGQYKESGYDPVAGDLIFLSTDNGDEPNHVGIISKVEYTEDGHAAVIHTIEGNSSNKVCEHTYDANSSTIQGYGILPENPIYLEMLAEQEKASESSELGTDSIQETPGVYAVADAADLSPYVTSVKGSGTIYDPHKDVYTTNLSLGFNRIPRTEIEANSYHYYYSLPDNIRITDDLVNNGPYEVYDGGVLGFTYNFIKVTQSDGSVTYDIDIKFNEAYLEKGDTVDGTLQFSADLDQHVASEDGSISKPFNGAQADMKLDIPVQDITYPSDQTVHYNMDITKGNGKLVEIEGKTKLQYEVIVSSAKGTPSPIDLTDVLQLQGLTVSNPQIVSVEKYTVTSSEQWGGSYSYQTGSKIADVNDYTSTLNGTDIALSLTGLEQNQQYKIVYTYDIEDDLQNNTSYSANNTVKGEATSSGGEKVSDTDSKKTTISKNILAKNARKSSDGSRIVWQLTINESQQNITNKQVTDIMLAETIDGTLNVSPDTGYEVNYDSNGKISGITFTGESNTNKYVITYETPVEPIMGNANEAVVTNTASFDGVSVSEGIGISGGNVSKRMLERTEVDATGQTLITWEVVINVPEGGIPAGTIIKEALNEYNGGSHYFTETQLNDYLSTLQALGIMMKDGSLKVGWDWKMNVSSFSELQDAPGVDKIQFELSQAVTGPQDITFSYTTTTSNPNAVEKTYTNQFTVGSHSSPKVEVKDEEKVKKEVIGNNNVTISSNDQTVSWRVMVKPSTDKKSYTITDTLPTGMQLTQFSYGPGKELNQIASQNTSYPVDESGVIGTPTSNANQLSLVDTPSIAVINNQQVLTLTVDTTSYTGDTFYVTYTCKLTEGEYQALTTNNKTFKNTVNVTTEGNIPHGNSSSDFYLKKEGETPVVKEAVVKKSGVWNNKTKSFDYSVQINSDALDLLPGKDYFSFSDDLYYWTSDFWDYDAELNPSSVKLYYARKGTDGSLVIDITRGLDGEVLDWNYNESNYKEDNGYKHYVLTGEIPDSEALILQYSYMIKPIAGFTSNYQNINGVNNTFKVLGQTEESGAISSSGNWIVEQTSGSITIGRSFRINKIDANNYRVKLAGAVFRIYKFNGTDFKQTNLTYTTNEEGYFEIRLQDENKNDLYDINTLYYVVEETAPEGYDMPENPRKYYFYFQNNNGEIAKPADFNLKDAVDLDKVDSIANVTNNRDTKSITVNKVWTDENNASFTPEDPDAYAEVQLYQCEITKAQYDALHASNDTSQIDTSNAIEYASHSLNASNAWTYTWENLPVKKNADIYYYYYVTETPINGYATTIERNQDQSITEGEQTIVTYSWTVTNKKAPDTAYNLPKTGGIGRVSSSMAGILLMLISMIFVVRLMNHPTKSNDREI